MKRINKFLVAALSAVAVAFIALVAISPSQAAPTRQTLSLIGGNTDASHAVGSQDPYTETSTDNGVTWGPAYLVGGSHPWGLVSGTNSWINCGPSLSDCLNATSLYRYRFWVPSDFSVPYLNGSMIMDNYGSVYLNGHALVASAPANYSFPANTNLAGKLVAGWNELRVELLDVGGLTGINFNLEVSVVTEGTLNLAAPGKLVIYDGQSGTASRTSDTVTGSNSIASLPTAVRSGYDFLGWFTAASPGGSIVNVPYTPAADTTLYAHWAPVYSITYDEQGGSAVPDSNYRTGGTVNLPSAPSLAGYVFEGWFDSATGGTRYGGSFVASGSSPISIYAQWSAQPAPQNNVPTVSPSPTPSTAQPNHFAKPIREKIAIFYGDSSDLRPHMIRNISTVSKKLTGSSEVACIGSTSGKRVTAFDRKLAVARAEKVCKRLQKLVPGLKFSISINPASSNLISARHVWVQTK